MKKKVLLMTLAFLSLGFTSYADEDISDEIVYYDRTDLDEVLKKAKAGTDDIVNSSATKEDLAYEIKDEIIYEKKSGRPVNNSYVHIKDKTYSTGENGEILRGKETRQGKNIYFGKDGALVKDDEVLADGGLFEADKEGTLRLIKDPKPGFVEFKEDSYYFNPDGYLARGMTDTEKGRFFFDYDLGYMLKDTIVGNVFIHPDGRANYIGWDYYEGKLGYFDKKSGYAKGLKTIGNITYGFDENGSIYRKQNRVFDGQNYYFNKFGEATKTDGNYPRGWVGDRYYFSDGKPAEGLVDINGTKYAFHERSLRLLRNTQKVFDHKLYKIDSQGRAHYQHDVAHAYLARGTNGAFRPGFSQNLMRKTPYFSQQDPRWSKRAFASGTMGGYGCGPTAMAMVLNRKLHTNDIYPTNTMAVARDYSSWDGTDWQYFIEGVEAYGLKSFDIPVQKDVFIQALKDNPIVIRVGAGHFINTGHYMVIDSYKDGKFIINDPYYMNKNTKESQPWARLRGEVTLAWEIK